MQLHGASPPFRHPGASLPRLAVFAQVGLQDRGVVLDLLGRAGGDGAAEIQDRHPLAEVHDHPHLVLDQDDGQAELVFQLADDADQVLGLGLVHARGGLVQEQQPGAADQGPGHLAAALLPVRQVPGRGVGVVGQLKALQQFPGPPGQAPLFVLERRGCGRRASTRP